MHIYYHPFRVLSIIYTLPYLSIIILYIQRQRKNIVLMALFHSIQAYQPECAVVKQDLYLSDVALTKPIVIVDPAYDIYAYNCILVGLLSLNLVCACLQIFSHNIFFVYDYIGDVSHPG